MPVAGGRRVGLGRRGRRGGGATTSEEWRWGEREQAAGERGSWKGRGGEGGWCHRPGEHVEHVRAAVLPGNI